MRLILHIITYHWNQGSPISLPGSKMIQSPPSSAGKRCSHSSKRWRFLQAVRSSRFGWPRSVWAASLNICLYIGGTRWDWETSSSGNPEPVSIKGVLSPCREYETCSRLESGQKVGRTALMNAGRAKLLVVTSTMFPERPANMDGESREGDASE